MQQCAESHKCNNLITYHETEMFFFSEFFFDNGPRGQKQNLFCFYLNTR